MQDKTTNSKVLCFCTFTIETGKVRGLEHEKAGCKKSFLVRSNVPRKNKQLEKQEVKIVGGGDDHGAQRAAQKQVPKTAQGHWAVEPEAGGHDQQHGTSEAFCPALPTAATSLLGRGSEAPCI